MIEECANKEHGYTSIYFCLLHPFAERQHCKFQIFTGFSISILHKGFFFSMGVLGFGFRFQVEFLSQQDVMERNIAARKQ